MARSQLEDVMNAQYAKLPRRMQLTDVDVSAYDQQTEIHALMYNRRQN